MGKTGMIGRKNMRYRNPFGGRMPARGFFFLCILFLVLPAQAGQNRYAPVFRFLGEFHKVEWKQRPVDVSRVAVNGPGDQKLALGTLKGKWTILNLWAMWCAPCVDELPRLDKLKGVMAGRNIDVLAVSIDRKATPDALDAFLTRHKALRLLPLHDTDKKLQKVLDPDVMPMTYIVNPEGRVVAFLYGPADWSRGDARAFSSLLADEGPGFIRLYAARDNAPSKP